MLPEDFKVKYIREAPQTGIIVLGETSTKTTLIKDYCLSFKEQKTEVTIFNTNSVEIQHFIGETVLGRWEPGLAEKVARKSFDNPEEIHILVLDNQLRSEII